MYFKFAYFYYDNFFPAHQLKKYSKPAFRKLQDELEAEKRKNKDLQLMISSKRYLKIII